MLYMYRNRRWHPPFTSILCFAYIVTYGVSSVPYSARNNTCTPSRYKIYIVSLLPLGLPGVGNIIKCNLERCQFFVFSVMKKAQDSLHIHVHLPRWATYLTPTWTLNILSMHRPHEWHWHIYYFIRCDVFSFFKSYWTCCFGGYLNAQNEGQKYIASFYLQTFV